MPEGADRDAEGMTNSTTPKAVNIAGDPAVRAAADRLTRALRSGTPCAPVRDLIGTSDVQAAYAVQQQVIAARRAQGARITGRKIGLTSPAVQAQLGVDRPDFGILLDEMDVSGLAEVPMGRLMQPKIEAEVAFVLADDLPADWSDSPFDDDRVRAAVAYAVPALEIVDSRIAGWDIRYADTVADNASSGLYVLGTQRATLAQFRPREVEMIMTLDGVQVSAGTGADCLGDPLAALAWLARTVRDLGDPLRAGEVVLSGALGPMIAVTPGARVEARITGLGTVTAVFSRNEENA